MKLWFLSALTALVLGASLPGVPTSVQGDSALLRELERTQDWGALIESARVESDYNAPATVHHIRGKAEFALGNRQVATADEETSAAAFAAGKISSALIDKAIKRRIERKMSGQLAPLSVAQAGPSPSATARRPSGDRDWADCADGRGDQAIAGCTRYIENPRNTAKERASAYYNRAFEYKERKDFDRAIADLTEAVRLDPGYARAFYLRAMVHREKGDVQNAIGDYRKTLQLDSSAHPARAALRALESGQDRPAQQAPRPPEQASVPPAAPPRAEVRVAYSVVVAGLELAQLDDELRRYFNIPAEVRGAVVIAVREPVARSSDPIVPGQVIVGVREAFSASGKKLVYAPQDVYRSADEMHKRGVREVELESKNRDGQLRMIWFNLPIAPPVEVRGTVLGTPAAVSTPSAQPGGPQIAQASASPPPAASTQSRSPQDAYAECTYQPKSMAEARSINRTARADACTAAIESGAYRGVELANLYAERASNYYMMKDYARAVADGERQFELDPKADIVGIYYRGESRMLMEPPDRQGAIRDMQLYLQKYQLLPRHLRGAASYEGLAIRARAALQGMEAPLPPPPPGAARDALDSVCTNLAGRTQTVSGTIEIVRDGDMLGFTSIADFTDKKTGCPMNVKVNDRPCWVIGNTVTATGRLKRDGDGYEVVLPRGAKARCQDASAAAPTR